MDENRNSIYIQAAALMQKDTEESLEQAMALFAAIRGWKDADRQAALCRTRLSRILWQKEYARLKAEEDRFEARVARWKKAGFIALAVLLLTVAVATTVTMLQFERYSRAAEFFTAGQYERAAEAFQAMEGYKDSRVRVYLSAVGMYHDGQYEKAIPYFQWLDGDYDNGYYLRKCYEHLEAQP